MVYTLFYNRLRDLSPHEQAEYLERAEALRALARAEHPGFVDIKTYTAEDGERLTVARFEDEESQKAWRLDPVHLDAQAFGRSTVYERFRLVICEPIREREWVHEEVAAAESNQGGGG